MEELKVGDVVQLKSGGPSMTISKILIQNEVICKFFTSDHKEMISVQLPNETLKLIRTE
jgi:uncharacterized protein YodC (DUF2158 family)